MKKIAIFVFMAAVWILYIGSLLYSTYDWQGKFPKSSAGFEFVFTMVYTFSGLGLAIVSIITTASLFVEDK